MSRLTKSQLRQLGVATSREWRVKKRAELKEILKAVDTYRLGCAYAPSYSEDVDELARVLERMRVAHSVKEWGR